MKSETTQTRRRQKTIAGYRDIGSSKVSKDHDLRMEASVRAAEDNFKLRFLHRRNELHRTQRDLAKAVGVSVNTIQTYEEGNLPRGGNLIQVAFALNCSVDWLFGMEGNGICISPEYLPPLDEKDSTNSMGGFTRVQHLDIPGADPVKSDTFIFSVDWLNRMSSDPDNIRMIFSPPLGKNEAVMLVDLGMTSVFQACNYLIKINEHYSMQRVSIRPGGNYLLHSDDDPLITPFEVPAGEVTILGRIIWISRVM